MDDRPVVVITGPWGFALGIAFCAIQRVLELMAPTWVAWVGSIVAMQALLLLFAATRGFEKARAWVRRILGRS
jgi:hypothetical protein